jgi:ribonuclease-3
VADDGPDHAKQFYARVILGGREWGRGEGRSKKQAEQAAARLAWEQLATEAEARDTVAVVGAAAAGGPGTGPAPPPGGAGELGEDPPPGGPAVAPEAGRDDA